MNKRFSAILVIVLIATLSLTATVFAAPTTGTTVTFDSGITTGSVLHVEDGTYVWLASGGLLNIGDHDGDLLDEELSIVDGEIVNVNRDGETFDLTSITLESTTGSILVEGVALPISTVGTHPLNLIGVTNVTITASGTNVIDDIVVNGGSTGGGGNGGGGNGGGGNDGNNGKKADKETICHKGGTINVSGNAKGAHTAHGDGDCA